MATLVELKHVVHEIAKANAIRGRNNVVTNTIQRVFDREADAAFGIIDHFFHPSNLKTINSRNKSTTKVVLIKPVGDHL